MGAKRKPEQGMWPEEEFLEKAKKEGRAKFCEELSMKALKPDLTFQARDIVGGLDVDNVRRLNAILRDTGRHLHPVTVFRCRKTDRHILADGFHRHAVYKKEKRTFIPAWIIDSDDAEKEARYFASMCNRITLLERTPADKKKAVFMLLDDEEYRRWSDAYIAVHVGISGPAVGRYRTEYASKHGVKMPESRLSANGRLMPAREPKRNFKASEAKVSSRVSQTSSTGLVYTACVNGLKLAASREDEISKKLEDLDSRKDAARKRILAARGQFSRLSLTLVIGSGRGLYCAAYLKDIKILCKATMVETFSEAREAAAHLFFAQRECPEKPERLVVACHLESLPEGIVEKARPAGIEFVDYDEFIASLKGK